MLTQLLQRLFRRSKHQQTVSGISRGASAYLFTAGRRERIFDADIAADPGMCRAAISVPTRHITRWLADDDGPTVADDLSETRTMETVLVGR